MISCLLEVKIRLLKHVTLNKKLAYSFFTETNKMYQKNEDVFFVAARKMILRSYNKLRYLHLVFRYLKADF